MRITNVPTKSRPNGRFDFLAGFKPSELSPEVSSLKQARGREATERGLEGFERDTPEGTAAVTFACSQGMLNGAGLPVVDFPGVGCFRSNAGLGDRRPYGLPRVPGFDYVVVTILRGRDNWAGFVNGRLVAVYNRFDGDSFPDRFKITGDSRVLTVDFYGPGLCQRQVKELHGYYISKFNVHDRRK